MYIYVCVYTYICIYIFGSVSSGKVNKSKNKQVELYLTKKPCTGTDSRGTINKMKRYAAESVQSLSRVQLCDPMGCSTSGFLSIINFWSLLRLVSIESVMPSNHLILCCPFLLLPSIFPSIRRRGSSLHQVAEVLEFQFQHQSFQ